MNAVVAAFNQEKALVGAFSVIVQPVVEPMDRFAALIEILHSGIIRDEQGNNIGPGLQTRLGLLLVLT